MTKKIEFNIFIFYQVIEACKQAAEIHGTGAAGTRNIFGTSELTNALENEIRDWHRTEEAFVLNGCYVANVETFSTLLGRYFLGAQCFSDAGNHRSMIEGIQKGKWSNKIRKIEPLFSVTVFVFY